MLFRSMWNFGWMHERGKGVTQVGFSYIAKLLPDRADATAHDSQDIHKVQRRHQRRSRQTRMRTRPPSSRSRRIV